MTGVMVYPYEVFINDELVNTIRVHSTHREPKWIIDLALQGFRVKEKLAGRKVKNTSIINDKVIIVTVDHV